MHFLTKSNSSRSSIATTIIRTCRAARSFVVAQSLKTLSFSSLFHFMFKMIFSFRTDRTFFPLFTCACYGQVSMMPTANQQIIFEGMLFALEKEHLPLLLLLLLLAPLPLLVFQKTKIDLIKYRLKRFVFPAHSFVELILPRVLREWISSGHESIHRISSFILLKVILVVNFRRKELPFCG